LSNLKAFGQALLDFFINLARSIVDTFNNLLIRGLDFVFGNLLSFFANLPFIPDRVTKSLNDARQAFLDLQMPVDYLDDAGKELLRTWKNLTLGIERRRGRVKAIRGNRPGCL